MMDIMRKEAICALIFLLALASGMAWTALLTGWPAELRLGRGESRARSCQVKEVDTDGRIVREPCDEWLRRQ